MFDDTLVGLKARREKLENAGAKFSILKNENQTWFRAPTGQSPHFEIMTNGDENNIMRSGSCLFAKDTWSNISSITFMPTDWLSKLSKELQSSLLSATKDQLRSKDNTTLHIGIGDVLTSSLFTVYKSFATYYLPGTVFIDQQVLTIIPENQKITDQRSFSIFIINQHNLSANEVLRKENTQKADIKTHYETKDDHGALK